MRAKQGVLFLQKIADWLIDWLINKWCVTHKRRSEAMMRIPLKAIVPKVRKAGAFSIYLQKPSEQFFPPCFTLSCWDWCPHLQKSLADRVYYLNSTMGYNNFSILSRWICSLAVSRNTEKASARHHVGFA